MRVSPNDPRRVSLEDAVLIALAFLMLTLDIIIVAVAPVVVEYVPVSLDLFVLGGASVVSVLGFAFIVKIPASWCRRIIYVRKENQA